MEEMLEKKLIKDNPNHKPWHETLEVGDEDHLDRICVVCTKVNTCKGEII